ncbi:hypothetical protein Bca52824_041310 [Brassica carinata]|uniref:MD-2-related lipid-recognition domain-containing protein n=1 Tax=Brassica carinata TaxID=52824 RepID=A0A8X7RUW5_BRACI|nr:hypothetical protein Bca52824_041310 [Brassica carinata]
MEMRHSQPLFLLLLVSLFFFPAALGSRLFTPCNHNIIFSIFFFIETQNYPVYVETVEIYPHPIKRSGNGEIWVTGYTDTNISDGATIDSLCDLVACPVAPGPIGFTLPNVFTEEELNRVLKRSLLREVTE